jgi:hypothetical protein
MLASLQLAGRFTSTKQTLHLIILRAMLARFGTNLCLHALAKSRKAQWRKGTSINGQEERQTAGMELDTTLASSLCVHCVHCTHKCALYAPGVDAAPLWSSSHQRLRTERSLCSIHGVSHSEHPVLQAKQKVHANTEKTCSNTSCFTANELPDRMKDKKKGEEKVFQRVL